MDKYYLAVDIGASSGRHMLASMKDGKMQLEEVYRFPNGMTEKNGTLCWDVERLFTEIKNGLKVCKELGKIPVSMAIDTPPPSGSGSLLSAVPATYLSSHSKLLRSLLLPLPGLSDTTLFFVFHFPL